MTDVAIMVLGGLVVAFTSGSIGKFIGANGKVSHKHCDERQSACRSLLGEKIDNLDGKVDRIIRAIEKANISVV